MICTGEEEEEIKENMQLKKEDAEEEEVKWAKHYSSIHSILLVGEGDFSFSLSLANAFGSASNLVATSLDSYDTVLRRYGMGKSNLEKLKAVGAVILHEVDATKMKHHPDLKNQKFDRIIFNFPHAGFIGSEDNMLVINEHKKLLHGFFENASQMLRLHGEVHVSHKSREPYLKWELKKLAQNCSLILIECTNFHILDYPGYNNKRGGGPECDQPFPLGECRTFIFRVGNTQKRRMMNQLVRPSFGQGRPFVETMATILSSPPASFQPPRIDRPHYPLGIGMRSMHEFQSVAGPMSSSCPRYDSGYFMQLEERHRRREWRREWQRELVIRYGRG